MDSTEKIGEGPDLSPYLDKIPAHVPRSLVKAYPFIRGLSTDENPFKTMVPKVHADMPDVFYCPYMFPGGRAAWVVRRAADLRAIYLDTDRFSNKAFSRGALIGEAWSNVPSETDPPMHGKYRTVLNPLFSPKTLAPLDEQARRYARGYIAKFRDRGSCEFLSDFAFRFPIAVFLDLMGLPQAQLELFLEWEHALLHEPDMAVIAGATRTVADYLRAEMADRRRNPKDDFISFGLTTEVDGRKLTEDELVGLCFNLYIGGLDTVSTNISWHFRHLAERPDHQKLLRDNPGLIPSALEELYRAYAAVTTIRSCVKETTIGEAVIMPGDWVAMSTTLASHDPAEFDQPEEVRLDRKPHHLAFAYGPHRCIGAQLARREAIIAMEEFLAVVPEFAVRPGEVLRTKLGSIIQPEALPLVWAA